MRILEYPDDVEPKNQLGLKNWNQTERVISICKVFYTFLTGKFLDIFVISFVYSTMHGRMMQYLRRRL